MRQPCPPSGLHWSGMPLVLPSLPHAAATRNGSTALVLIAGDRNTLRSPTEKGSAHVAQLTLCQAASSVYVPLLDRILYRHPFEGASARRYATLERPAFGDLDERILDALRLDAKYRLLDLGCGPGKLAEAARRRGVDVVAVDPSRDFANRPGFVRAAGEALPLADRSVDVAVCLSSLRHVQDREQTLRELRRVVRERLLVVELDPAADRARIANHADHLGSRVLRRAFGPLVVRTAPPAAVMQEVAERAGWQLRSLAPDPVQPVYFMELG
jgi:SAM-dependent methyltransferase